MNKLADFHFDVRYRPAKANADTDTLSRMLISFEEYMSGCSEMVSQDVLNVVTSSINESNSTKLPGCHLSQRHLLCWKKSLVVFQLYPQVTFQLRRRKIQPSLVFYTSCRTEDTPPTRKSSKNGMDCFFQKIEFSIINLDLGIK